MVWNINDVRGAHEAVKSKLDGNAELPDSTKVFIASQLEDLKAKGASGYKVDAYCQDNQNKSSMTLTRNVQISIVGIML